LEAAPIAHLQGKAAARNGASRGIRAGEGRSNGEQARGGVDRGDLMVSQRERIVAMGDADASADTEILRESDLYLDCGRRGADRQGPDFHVPGRIDAQLYSQPVSP